jgi:NADH dehydrogenase
MGVEVWLNTTARDMDSASVTVTGPDGDRRIPARTRIWAAGVQASPLAALLAGVTGAGTDRAGWVAVRPDCSLPGHPEVFAVGDMIQLNDLPGVAQPAIQEGTYVGKLIRPGWRATPEQHPLRTATRAAWPPSATCPPSPTRSG